MKTHRDLLAWQKARAVTRGVIALSISSWKPQFGAVFDQVQRSSLSAQINVAEGYAFFSDSALWRNHRRIAYGSAIETGDLLELMVSFDHFRQTRIGTIVETCRESQQLLFGLMRKYGALKIMK